MNKKALVNSNLTEQDKLEVESTNYDLDKDKDFETNSELIKYEFNLIELPFFTKDKNVRDGVIKEYLFSTKKKQSMRVIPSRDPKMISNKIPQEFDEKIFYGILKLSKEQHSDTVITDYFTLAKVSDVNYKHLNRIKDSIQRLRRCSFELNNLYYSSTEGKLSKDTKDFSILQDLEIYDLETVMDLKDIAKKEQYQKYFRNSKIDHILILTLSKRIYENMKNKHGFLYFNQKNLLEIDSATARKLYILITKWQGWEKKNQIRRSCRFIASRLPLSWEPASVSGTINYLGSAAMLLKEKKLIFNYVLTKTKPITDSYIDFYFSDETSPLIEYNKVAASITTGHENLVIESSDDFLDERQSTIFDMVSAADVENLFREVPEAERTESVKKLLEKFASKGSDYIKSNILYTNTNCPENYPGYLSRALADDYAAIEREKAELKAQQEKEKKEREAAAAAAEKARKEELQRKAAEKYNSMTEEEKAAFLDKLKRRPFFEMVLKSLGDDISKAAIFAIASELEKES